MNSCYVIAALDGITTWHAGKETHCSILFCLICWFHAVSNWEATLYVTCEDSICTFDNQSYWTKSIWNWSLTHSCQYIEYFINTVKSQVLTSPSKMPCLPIILINFSWVKFHNFFIMEKSKFTLLFNICWNWLIYST